MALLSRLMRNEKIPEESASSSNDEELLRLAPQDPVFLTFLGGDRVISPETSSACGIPLIRNSNAGTVVQRIGLTRPSTSAGQARLRPAQITERASSKRNKTEPNG
jgi:hypothetical protein